MVQTNLGVMVFAATGAGEAGITYSDYEYEEDLASSATYTPPANTMFIYHAEEEASNQVNLEWYNSVASGWVNKVNLPEEKIFFSQGTSQRVRLMNDSGSAQGIGLYGVTWTGLTEYEHEEDLASATSYTPPANTFFIFFAETLGSSAINLEWYNLQTSTWFERIAQSNENVKQYQSANQRVRLMNDNGLSQAIGLYGETHT